MVRRTSLNRIDDSLRNAMIGLQREIEADLGEQVSLVDVSAEVADWLKKTNKEFLRNLK